MPEEIIRSVVAIEGETQGAETALDRIEKLLTKIRRASLRTERAWRRVIQTMGETGAIRVVGMDKLLQGIEGIQSAMSAGIGVSRQYSQGLDGVATRAESAAQAQDRAARATRRAAQAAREAQAGGYVSGFYGGLGPGRGPGAGYPSGAGQLPPGATALVTQQQQFMGAMTAAFRWQQWQQQQQAQQIRALLPGGGLPTGGWQVVGGPGGAVGGALMPPGGMGAGGAGGGPGGAGFTPPGGGGGGGAGGGGFLGGIGRTFQTHLRWMARYIILWKGMQVVQSTIEQWIRVNAELDRSLTLLSTSLGGGTVQLREYREAMFAAARAGRALPTEMAPAAVMTGRIFEPEEAQAVMTQAAELAFVSGGKVADITGTLIVMQRQLGISSEEMGSVMDALAGSLRNTHLTYADMIPMLQRAVVFSDRFNMTVEETIGLQAGVAGATGATSGQLDAMLRRLQDIYVVGSDANLALGGLGIAAVSVLESGEHVRMPLIAIIEALGKAIKDNQPEVENLSETLFRSGSIARTTWEATIKNSELVTQGYYNATQSVGQWGKTVDAMAETQSAAIARVKGSWQEFLASIAVTIRLPETLNDISDGLDNVSTSSREAAASYEDWIEAAKEQGGPSAKWALEMMEERINLGPMGNYLMAQMFQGLGPAPAAGEAERGVIGERVGYPQLPPGGVGGPQLPMALDVKTATLEVPEGANFDDVIKSYDEIVKRWEGTFQDQSGKTYRITQQQITDAAKLTMIWDETGNEFRLFRAFLPALQEAIQENTAALKEPGLRFTQFDPVKAAVPMQQLVSYYSRIAKEVGFTEEPSEQLLWGPDDSILKLDASNRVLQLVMHGLTEAVNKNTEALNEGMWNIPEGVTALVPITSLFYQGLSKPGGGGLKDADIQMLADLITGRGETIAGEYGDGAAGGGLGGAGGPSRYGFFTGGPAGEFQEAGTALNRAASNLTSAAFALQLAARAETLPVPYLPPIRGAAGAVVTQPTWAMIGDRGPEAVVPLNQTPGSSPLGAAGQDVIVHMTMMMDERILAEVTRKAVAEVF